MTEHRGHTGGIDRRTIQVQALVYGLAAIALWPIPVFNVLHVEAAAVVAAVSFFCAGIASVGLFRGGRSLWRVLLAQLGLLGIPWALLTLTLCWTPNKGYWTGLGLFALLTPFSVGVAVSLAWAVVQRACRYPRSTVVAVGVLIAVLGPVYDLGFHPQFYTYNLVFGAVLGPIYDEELSITRGLFFSRAIAVLWAALLVAWGRPMQTDREARWTRMVRVAAPVLLVLAYAFPAGLRVNTTQELLDRELGGRVETDHFVILFRDGGVSEPRTALLAAWHEYRYEQLRARTGLDAGARVRSYLYPDPDTKGRLTGARYTNVAPLWLRDPQTHLLASSFEWSFAHELAHVFSRSIGLPVLRASLSIGLVEGWAEALEPPNGYPDVHRQVAASLLVGDSLGTTTPERLARSLSRQIVSLSFWTGRSAVSYTVMGSFVRFLLDAYGLAPFASVYRGTSWDRAYGKSAEVLVAEWISYLKGIAPSSGEAAYVAERFSRPSLFEKPSPHYVPKPERLRRAGQAHLALGDTVSALEAFERGLTLAPDDVALLDGWAQVTLATSRPRDVTERLQPRLMRGASPFLWVRYGDALVWLGHAYSARIAYAAALEATGLYERDLRARIELRMALAGFPAFPVATYGARSADDRVARIAALDQDTVATALLHSLALTETDRTEEALSGWPDCGVLAAETLRDQCSVWRGDVALLAGSYALARAAYRAAELGYERRGDTSAVDFLVDRGNFADWLALRVGEGRHFPYRKGYQESNQRTNP